MQHRIFHINFKRHTAVIICKSCRKSFQFLFAFQDSMSRIIKLYCTVSIRICYTDCTFTIISNAVSRIFHRAGVQKCASVSAVFGWDKWHLICSEQIGQIIFADFASKINMCQKFFVIRNCHTIAAVGRIKFKNPVLFKIRNIHKASD